nr:putative ribonuclease H-like domain-containing protein [Tanacetum cinerariifolium]
VTAVFNKVNAAKSRVTTAIRVSTVRWIKWLEDQDMREVIKNGNKVLKKTVGTVEQIYKPTSVKEKLDRKNEIKARGTLLMALPNKDQLKFHSYQDAKLLMEAIEKRYEGNKESKKVQRILLKQQYKKFVASSLETLDQTFDRLQKLISQWEIQGEVIEQKDINLKENLEQIDLDDLEEMDLHWKMAMLTIRARSQVSDKVKTRLGYKAASPAVENFVNLSKMIENQENVKSRSDKRYHEVPLPYTGNYIPPKPDLMFIDKQVESESVDVVSNVSSSVVKTVESKVESVNVKNKGIKREFSVARTPQQNGVAERKNRTLIKAARTMIVEETLNIRFLENAPNVKGNEPDWLFDIDSLIISMNCVPVVTGFQTNSIVGTKDDIIAGQAEKKKEPEQEYILIPICTTDPLISQSPKDSAVDTRKKVKEL